jgi:two-component system, chemotaxis family, chemotaxis protein CheY
MLHCLVVDDSKIIRTVHAKLMAQLGFRVSAAADGAMALESCRATMPDIILVDWNMPVMDGLTFVHLLRALPNGGLPKVLLCTIESDLDHITRAVAEGADEYIMKPFDIHILASKLMRVGVSIPVAPSRSDPLAEI